MKNSNNIIFSGSSHVKFAKDLVQSLDVSLGNLKIDQFPDGEIGVEILEDVEGKNVFVVQSLANRPNHFLMELLLIVDALKRASAKSIVCLIPYLAYSRQDKKDGKQTAISSRLVADLLEKAGVTKIITMDLHTDQIQGFFNIPVTHLSSEEIFQKQIGNFLFDDPVIVAPDLGRAKFVKKFAKKAGYELAFIDKNRIGSKEVECSALIGQVQGRDVILIDDICSTGSTLKAASILCKQNGAKRISVFVTHGLFAKNVLDISEIDQFFVTDTVEMLPHQKLAILSVTGLFAKAVMKNFH